MCFLPLKNDGKNRKLAGLIVIPDSSVSAEIKIRLPGALAKITEFYPIVFKATQRGQTIRSIEVLLSHYPHHQLLQNLPFVFPAARVYTL